MSSFAEKPKLVFATNNRHKFEEIKHILEDRVTLLSLSDIGCDCEIPEDHATLEENAAQKAFFVYDRFGFDCFADDTGLEIDALNGNPGVFSARFAGEKCTFEDNVNLVLLKMQNKSNRNARFRTVIALVEKGRLITFEGAVKGIITLERQGTGGFGYDPVFMPEGQSKTFGEMTFSEKNELSHRALAIAEFARHFLTGDRSFV